MLQQARLVCYFYHLVVSERGGIAEYFMSKRLYRHINRRYECVESIVIRIMSRLLELR